MYYIVFTMYRLLQHEIKTVQITFYFNILFKSQSHPPQYLPTMYLSQPGLTHVIHGLLAWIYVHPSYKTVKQFAQTSQTLPEKYVHAYPMSIQLVSPRILCASWISRGCRVTRLV